MPGVARLARGRRWPGARAGSAGRGAANSSAIAALPSVEPSSTMITSRSPNVCAASDSRHGGEVALDVVDGHDDADPGRHGATSGRPAQRAQRAAQHAPAVARRARGGRRARAARRARRRSRGPASPPRLGRRDRRLRDLPRPRRRAPRTRRAPRRARRCASGAVAAGVGERLQPAATTSSASSRSRAGHVERRPSGRGCGAASGRRTRRPAANARAVERRAAAAGRAARRSASISRAPVGEQVVVADERAPRAAGGALGLEHDVEPRRGAARLALPGAVRLARAGERSRPGGAASSRTTARRRAPRRSASTAAGTRPCAGP